MSEAVQTDPVVSIEKMSFRYGSQYVLQDIDLQVEPRDFIGLIGPNGGGKTTLLKIILGLLQPQAGAVRLFGLPPEQGRRFAGYVAQSVQFDRDFPISVMDIVLMGRLREARKWGRTRAEDREAAEQALEQMEILDFRRRTLGELSGGQIQRVLIARALAGRPKLLALDEPTANIDSRFQHEIHDILRRLNEKMTLILISHDLGFISGYVNRVACLNRQMVCHPTTDIDGQIIEELYHGHVHIVRHGQEM